ncbi:MAG: hypothetical protein QME74_11365 [Candidatus Edwardsbacteria bacterium]|nr:hypothetical protein [Candidatus Edwardsbacteria bacterium]
MGKLLIKAVFIGIAVWGVWKSGLNVSKCMAVVQGGHKALLTRYDMQNIGNAIAANAALGNALPDPYSFRAWCKQNFTAKGKAADEDYWDSPYAFMAGRDSFKIFSDGPDKIPQTEDDLEEGFTILKKAAPDIKIEEW